MSNYRIDDNLVRTRDESPYFGLSDPMEQTKRFFLEIQNLKTPLCSFEAHMQKIANDFIAIDEFVSTSRTFLKYVSDIYSLSKGIFFPESLETDQNQQTFARSLVFLFNMCNLLSFRNYTRSCNNKYMRKESTERAFLATIKAVLQESVPTTVNNNREIFQYVRDKFEIFVSEAQNRTVSEIDDDTLPMSREDQYRIFNTLADEPFLQSLFFGRVIYKSKRVDVLQDIVGDYASAFNCVNGIITSFKKSTMKTVREIYLRCYSFRMATTVDPQILDLSTRHFFHALTDELTRLEESAPLAVAKVEEYASLADATFMDTGCFGKRAVFVTTGVEPKKKTFIYDGLMEIYNLVALQPKRTYVFVILVDILNDVESSASAMSVIFSMRDGDGFFDEIMKKCSLLGTTMDLNIHRDRK